MSHGTLPVVQYSKYRKSAAWCNTMASAMGHLYYDKEWASLAYFVSLQKTAFERTMLANFDHELLIGQISYKQEAEIYNAFHGYECIKKQCSSLKLTNNAQNSRYGMFIITAGLPNMCLIW